MIEPDTWPKSSGYSPAILAEGRCLFLAGQIGWDVRHNLACGLTAQVEQALCNINTILEVAGARPSHLVRLLWYVVDCGAFDRCRIEIGAAYRRVIGRHYPAMSVVEVRRLLEPGALVEIEATAVLHP